ncbi:MAG: hypothetical protein ACYSUN_09600 [Planctomycetota bacterium]|jgi:hypothetical protein
MGETQVQEARELTAGAANLLEQARTRLAAEDHLTKDPHGPPRLGLPEKSRVLEVFTEVAIEVQRLQEILVQAELDNEATMAAAEHADRAARAALGIMRLHGLAFDLHSDSEFGKLTPEMANDVQPWAFHPPWFFRLIILEGILRQLAGLFGPHAA